MDINTASAAINKEVHVIGVVSDFMPPSKSRGTDWMLTFSIADWSYGSIDNPSNEGLKVRFFRPLKSDLPPINGTGDVVVLRSVKVKQWAGMILAMSAFSTAWTVVPALSIMDRASSAIGHFHQLKDARAPPLSKVEINYVQGIIDSQDKSHFTSVKTDAAATLTRAQESHEFIVPARREKFSLIKDMQANTYYDMVGQVVKLYASMGRVDLYVTDYTGNDGLYFYEWGQDEDGEQRDDEKGFPSIVSKQAKKWPGPFGKMTLAVTLWPPHSEFVNRNVRENDFVHLRNLHVRFDKDTKIVGSLHEDRMNSDRIYVSLIHDLSQDDCAKEVLRRKQEYHRKFDLQSKKFILEARDHMTRSGEEGKPLSKGQARKKRKQDRKGEQIDQEGHAAQSNTKRKRTDREGCFQHDLISEKRLRTTMNSNVNCSNHTIPLRPLSSIASLDTHANRTPAGTEYVLPFQNIKSRTTARVVDYFPHELEDFAIPTRKQSEYAALSDLEDSSGDSDYTSRESTRVTSDDALVSQDWEWRFALVLEDTSRPQSGDKATIRAYVVGPDAECLLKLDAEDLRTNSRALSALREKLFLLWGNLEEKKAERRDREELGHTDEDKTVAIDLESTGRPFQCCLREYGVKRRVTASLTDENSERNGAAPWEWQRRWRLFGCTIV